MKFTVTESAMRPASDARRCFYCRSVIGQHHAPDCVLAVKKIIVKLVIEYEVEVPASWEDDAIEFRFNESSWCANNAIEDLYDRFCGDDDDDGACACESTQIKYVSDVSGPYAKES